MRSVLIVLGIAVLAIGFSAIVSPRNPESRLSGTPQEDLWRLRAIQEDAAKRAAAPAPATEKDFQPSREGVLSAVLSVKDRGEVAIELYPKAAPKAVERVSRLIRSGFYNGLRFHRVVPDFVVQAGDPQSKTQPMDSPTMGQKGSGTNIAFDTNTLPHLIGALGMALNSPRSATADSQFFINLKNNDQLNGDYCVIGRVIKGMELVSQIQQGDTITRIVIQ